MASTEDNHEDWVELRARVDSIANAVFLVAGGALSLSISVILDKKAEPFITSEVARSAVWAWYSLLSSVLFFLGLKVYLVWQAFLRQQNPEFLNRNLCWLNRIGWLIGLLGFGCFSVGFWLMVHAASTAVVVKL
jgi:hypothetical protein